MSTRAPQSYQARPLRERIARAWRIPDDCKAAHAELIRTRLATLAPLLAVLTVAWLGIELAWFGAAQIRVSVTLRLTLAAALLGLDCRLMV